MKFNIILSDNPWEYRDRARSGNRGAECKYPVLKDEDIYALPVEQIAADDCILFTWATLPKIQEALNSIKAWGFEYKTNAFTWVKRNKINQLTWFWGMGRWTRSNAELCLLATKGKPKRVSAAVHSIIEAPIMRHSAKPPEVRDRIVKLCGDLPRIELFAREQVTGWVSLGNDIDGKDIRDSLKEIIDA